MSDLCIEAFCKLCEEAVLNELIDTQEYQYWVFERGFIAKDSSLATFSRLCEEAEKSDLISTIDCQYWLFERGYIAAKKLQMLSNSLGENCSQGSSQSTAYYQQFSLQ